MYDTAYLLNCGVFGWEYQYMFDFICYNQIYYLVEVEGEIAPISPTSVHYQMFTKLLKFSNLPNVPIFFEMKIVSQFNH